MALGGRLQGTVNSRHGFRSDPGCTCVPWVTGRSPKQLWAEVWVPAALSVSLLCTCFILSSLVTQNNSVYSSIGKRLSKLRDHQKHLSVACRREAEGESWGCCPSAWRLFEASCYFVSTAVQPWNASREACAAWEAELAVIRTREEQDFIIQNLEDSSAYYIGLSDPEGLRHWQWVDQMLYNASATFWHPGEPNRPEERCAVLSFRQATGSWGWNDVACDVPQESVCRMPPIRL